MSSHQPSKPKVVSSGVLIHSPEGWLLAHATRTPRWDIPKGKIEPGESAVDAALRETREEIGIDLLEARDRLVDLGRHAYLPKKDLHLFTLSVPVAFSLKKCRCSCMIAVDGGHIPETDDYRWIPVDKVREYIGKGLASYMAARGLLPPGNSPGCRGPGRG